jgi:hypothetical protein
MLIETITPRIYTSRRDAILDIFLMVSQDDANTIASNLMHTNSSFTIGNITMETLIDTFIKVCEDNNLTAIY